MNTITGFLYARPSFLEGFSRIFDFFGTLQEYNTTKSGEIADSIALAMDVEAIGQDMRDAISIFIRENADHIEPQE